MHSYDGGDEHATAKTIQNLPKNCASKQLLGYPVITLLEESR